MSNRPPTARSTCAITMKAVRRQNHVEHACQQHFDDECGPRDQEETDISTPQGISPRVANPIVQRQRLQVGLRTTMRRAGCHNGRGSSTIHFRRDTRTGLRKHSAIRRARRGQRSAMNDQLDNGGSDGRTNGGLLRATLASQVNAPITVDRSSIGRSALHGRSRTRRRCRSRHS